MRTLFSVLALLSMLAASGCHRTRASVAPTVPATLAQYARQVPDGTRCDRVEQVLLVLPGVIQVRGCGERREYVVGRGRRSPAQAITGVAPQAAIEMRCTEGDLRVDSPAPAVRGVSGCGRRARYDLLCADQRCEWTMTAHAGAWAGLASSVPEGTEPTWPLPFGEGSPSYGTYAPSEGDDLSSVPLPPPPGAAIPPPPGADDEPLIPPPPSP